MEKEFRFVVYGAGDLGARVIGQWDKSQLGSKGVAAVTLSDSRHSSLVAFGVIPLLSGATQGVRTESLLFCVPPSASADYLQVVTHALNLWTGNGAFLFTSSTAVYVENQGGEVLETSGVDLTSPRCKLLVDAEALVLSRGGTVLRLAGLYDSKRGPHVFYSKQNELTSSPNGWINLIHYDDAASLCKTILSTSSNLISGKIFLGCDNRPIKRREIVESYGAGRISQIEWTGEQGVDGKRCQNQATRSALNWQPRWGSFIGYSNRDLILEIENAFVGIAPGIIGIREASAMDQRLDKKALTLARSADSEKDWRMIPDNIFKENQDVLGYLDEIAFKFLLPGIMRWSLVDNNYKEWLTESLYYHLVSNSRDPSNQPTEIVKRYELRSAHVRTVVRWIDCYITLSNRHPTQIEIKNIEFWKAFVG